MSPTPPAGWHPDPERPGQMRYWDGAQWTDHRSPATAATAPQSAVPSSTGTYGGGPAPKSNSGCLKWGIIGAIVVVLLGGGLVVGCILLVQEGADRIERTFGVADPDDYEVVVDECSADEAGIPTAIGTLENTAGHAQAYQVAVSFSRDDDIVVGSGTASTVKLGEDQKGQWSVTAPSVPEGTTLECEVTEVRYTVG
jgi:Protein of unknown function (DUF2510)